MSITNHLLTVQELATYLKCSTTTIYRMVDEGLIPYYLVRREYRFDLQKVLTSIEVKDE